MKACSSSSGPGSSSSSSGLPGAASSSPGAPAPLYAGKSALLRVVTFGDTSTNSIDVSPQAFTLLDSGESPRTMTWQFAQCADTNHGSFVELTRGSDGALTDDAGFGNGAFTIRMTSIDGTQLTETIAWPSAGIGGQTLIGTANFP